MVLKVNNNVIVMCLNMLIESFEYDKVNEKLLLKEVDDEVKKDVLV